MSPAPSPADSRDPGRGGDPGLSGFAMPGLDALRRRLSVKWRRYPPPILPAWVAEMDFTVAEPIGAALRAAVADGDVGYPSTAQESGLAEATAAWLAATFDWTVDPAEVVALPDVMAGIELALRVGCRPGSGVVVTTPIYPPFFHAVADTGHVLTECPLVLDGGVRRLDLAAIDAALAGGADAVLLCNPHNPTGRVFEATELSALAALVERHGALLVADEIHGPLVYPGRRHVPVGALAAPDLRLVTLVGASKGWNLPGLRCALAVIGSQALRADMLASGYRVIGGCSELGVIATIAAFGHGRPWLSDAMTQLEANRATVASRLAAEVPEVGFVPPEGTYLAWLDCRRVLAEARPAAWLQHNAGVALSEGADFGSNGEGWVRLNFATSPVILEEILDRLIAALGRG